MVVVAALMEHMEAAVEAPAGQNKDISAVAKGKRTKRQRPHSPIPFTITPPPETAAATDSASASSEESTTTEEVNTARWLILLSQGHFDRRYDEAATTSYGGAARAAGGGSACVYTCKTCNRSFASFQALGGHRASHKKPKNEKKVTMFYDDEDFPSPNSLSLQLSSGSTATFSIAKSSPSPRIHVCSHCGAEFTSGQALGGHMRKHRGAGPIIRSFNIPPEASVDELEPEESDKLAIGLALDLNLPAPVDDKEKKP